MKLTRPRLPLPDFCSGLLFAINDFLPSYTTKQILIPILILFSLTASSMPNQQQNFGFCLRPPPLVSRALMPRQQYRFCFGPWNLSEGQDPYGPTTRPPQTFDWTLAHLKKLG